jgi:hypothetical protein
MKLKVTLLLAALLVPFVLFAGTPSALDIELQAKRQAHNDQMQKEAKEMKAGLEGKSAQEYANGLREYKLKRAKQEIGFRMEMTKARRDYLEQQLTTSGAGPEQKAARLKEFDLRAAKIADFNKKLMDDDAAFMVQAAGSSSGKTLEEVKSVINAHDEELQTKVSAFLKTVK